MLAAEPAPTSTPRKRSAVEASDDSDDDAPAAPVKKRPVGALYDSTRGEKIAWSDDELEAKQNPKKVRPAPPPRRLVVASRGTLRSLCEAFTDNDQKAHVFSLCWRIDGNSSRGARIDGVTHHHISDDDKISYDIGAGNINSKSDPTMGTDLGAAEMIGLAAVAADISEVLTNDPKCGVVVADLWGRDYAPLVVGLATRLFTVANRNAPAVSSGVKKPRNQNLKELLKGMGRVGSEEQMKTKLHEFYRNS